MSGLPVILWIGLALWSAIIVYVFVNIRRVMRENNARIARLFGAEPAGITERGVLFNRIALVTLLVASNWAILSNCGSLLP